MRQNRSFFVQMDPPKGRRSDAARPGSSQKKKREASPKREASVFPGTRKLLLRLIAASILFAFVLISHLPAYVDTILLVIVALLAGYDLLGRAFQAIRWGNFLAEPVILILVTILAFLTTFGEEGAALLILYQAMKLLVRSVSERSVRSAYESIDEREEEIRSMAAEVLQEEDASVLGIASVMDRTVSPVLTAAMAVAVLYAVLLPVVLQYNIRVAVHRAITILLVCTPFSLLAAMPVLGKISLSCAAALGTVFRRAADLELLDGTGHVILEKDCIPGGEEAKLVSYTSTNLDDNTFFMLIRHMIRSSQQAFAKTILQQTSSDFIPGLVMEFAEAPGGVEAVINGTQGVFGTRSYLSRFGLSAPAIPEDQGVYYYLFLGGRYGGNIILSETGKNTIEDVVHNLRFAGINKCSLICTESAEEITEFSQNSDVDEVYAGIHAEERVDVIDELCASSSQRKVYIRPSDPQRRSAADIEIRVGASIGDADGLCFPEYYVAIPSLFLLSRRIREIATENTVIAFAVKILLIFFSMIGYCNLWVAVTVDMTAAIITILNSNRVATKSLIRTFLDR